PPFLFVKSLYEKCRMNFENSLQNLIDYSIETGVPISLENIPMNLSFCYTLEHLIDYVNRFENLKVTLDIPHAYIMKDFYNLQNHKNPHYRLRKR
ncbi:MAG: TIM barrel protein, partial [Candidatus Jordarchaeaceae archaeon]